MNSFYIKCKFEVVFDGDNIIGLILDLSNSVEISISFIESIILNKINSITLADDGHNSAILIKRGVSEICYYDKIEIHMSETELETLKSMLLDSFLNRGFEGFHLDIDVPSSKGEVQVCFLLQ